MGLARQHHTIRAVVSLTPAARILADEIANSGPIPFSRFMEVALYHPEAGYYRKPRDPFGIEGDFYTAEQLQPVFGRLIAKYLGSLADELGAGSAPTVVELGAGRAEMKEAFARFRYIPIEIGQGTIPNRVTGVFFSNEFFDAVPVDIMAARSGMMVERRVTFDGERFRWIDGEIAGSTDLDEGTIREIQKHRLEWLDRIDKWLERGFIVTIDYGYTDRELIRFPQGTLMRYRKHQAYEDVLTDPGTSDITAHVAFTELRQHGERLGWSTIAFESLAGMLMRAGAADQFASALAGSTETERAKHRMQLKSLLFGMGETFRVLVQRKG